MSGNGKDMMRGQSILRRFARRVLDFLHLDIFLTTKDKIAIDRKISFPDGAVHCERRRAPGAHGGTAAVFALFSADGKIKDETVRYIAAFAPFIDHLVVVGDCPIFPEEADRLLEYAESLIFERHREYDFGSYKRGVAELRRLGHYDGAERLILFNDTMALTSEPLDPLIARGRECDAFGLFVRANGPDPASVRSLPFGRAFGRYVSCPHIQSYFVMLSEKVFKDESFARFLENVKEEESKLAVIYNYEMGLGRVIRSLGVELASYGGRAPIVKARLAASHARRTSSG